MNHCEDNNRIKYELELKEFMNKVKQEEIKEKINNISWKPKLGECPVSEEKRKQILEERQCQKELYENACKVKYFGEPGKIMQRITRTFEMAPPPIRHNTSAIIEDDWTSRQITLDRFIQAARKVIVRRRLERRLKQMQDYIYSCNDLFFCSEGFPQSDLVAPSHIPLPPSTLKIDITMNIHNRKMAKVHPYCVGAPKADCSLIEDSDMTQPLNTRSFYDETSAIDALIFHYEPSSQFEMVPYDDEETLNFNINESNSKNKENTNQVMDKEKSAKLEKQEESENPYSPSNLPTLDSSLYKTKCQEIIMVNYAGKQIFEEHSHKSFLSKSTMNNCVYNYLILDSASVPMRMKPTPYC